MGIRAVVGKVTLRDLLPYKAHHRAKARYVLTTDISEFYHSIYTHSIPWAIHGKAQAEANRTAALYGNKIDELLRNAQDGQTIGIPIGPDTSLIVAESILSAVDQELLRRIPDLAGYRYIDDYDLAFVDQSTADRALATLQEILLEYELRLNPRKTMIHELPIRLEPAWVSELRNLAIRNDGNGQKRDLIRNFDRITDYVQESPNDSVVKFGMVKLQSVPIDKTNWDLFQSLLCHALVIESGAISEIVQVLMECQRRGLTLARSLLEPTLNQVIERLAPLGHDYEVSWAIWAIMVFGFNNLARPAEVISNVENPVVAILALDADQKRLVPAGLQKGRWETRMQRDELYEDQWLLSYEANVHNWLPTRGSQDHVAQDPNFSHLKALGVSFYTPVTGPVPIRKRRIAMKGYGHAPRSVRS